ncbi:Esterase/lipase/thioesterase [Serendipita sp. 397]|nr:Esterase/lipase/thioesterase [Serendipita sp. 397]KAG8799761.1 Esterase/lipase/thioesterase [Serendipita sp. 398]
MIRVLAVLALAATQVVGHGYVPQIQIGSNWYAGWDVTKDPYTSPAPLRPVRRTPNDSGFISDLVANNFTAAVTIPSKLAAGNYLLRHENLALHGATSLNGAQFYPVCIHLTVTGGGSVSPSGLAFPGAYKQNDPGILFNPYQGDAANQAYVAPGGAVYKF